MRFPDPYALRRELPKETVLFAASQLTGAKPNQEDYFLNFDDEYFVVSDGVGSIPNGDIAAKFACETAVWAYKHIRQHRYYWLDKKLFMKRIYRTTNMAVWNKSREPRYEEGLATTLLVLMVGPKNIWLGNSGDSSAWIFHDGAIKKLTKEKSDFQSVPTGALGVRRLGLAAEFATSVFEKGDVLLLATDGVSDYLTLEDMQACFSSVGDQSEDITKAVSFVLHAAEVNGSNENMTALLVKRV